MVNQKMRNGNKINLNIRTFGSDIKKEQNE